MTIVANNSLTISNVNDGIGVTSTVITYANSTSGTTAPSTGWTSSIPSPVKGQYLWTKTVWTSTDTSTKTAYSVSYNSKDGTNGTDGTSGIIVSSVAPASPKTGQLWQDTSTTPQLVKKWTGSSWVIWEFYAQNLKSDSLETVSSKIGNIYNEFTLEDGTTGTLHIGNSEYRINSQVLKDKFLFKENIFFDPDGVNFTFEGDNTSNSGYGNYSKSGSDFYLQNNQMASYTVSGIRMSNEFAGYSIKIHDANHKLNFISKNGQGFDFTGPVSFNGIPMNTTSSVTVALFYGITVDFRRQGNLVIASIGRQLRTTSTPGEDVVILEKVPSGYRPSYLHYFEINRNSSNNVLTGLIMGFEPNGDVRVTIGSIETAIFSGSTSYFTTDPLP